MSLAISRVAALVGASLVLVGTESSARGPTRRLGSSATQRGTGEKGRDAEGNRRARILRLVKTAGELNSLRKKARCATAAKKAKLRGEAANKAKLREQHLHCTAGVLTTLQNGAQQHRQHEKIAEPACFSAGLLQRARNAPCACPDNSPQGAKSDDELSEIERNFLHEVELQKQAEHVARTRPVYASTPRIAFPACFLKKTSSPEAKPMVPRTVPSKVSGIDLEKAGDRPRIDLGIYELGKAMNKEHDRQEKEQGVDLQEKEHERKMIEALKLKIVEAKAINKQRKKTMRNMARTLKQLKKLGPTLQRGYNPKAATQHLENLERSRHHSPSSWELEAAKKVSSGEAKRAVNKGRKIPPTVIHPNDTHLSLNAAENSDYRSPPSLRGGRYRKLSFDETEAKKSTSPQSIASLSLAREHRLN